MGTSSNRAPGVRQLAAQQRSEILDAIERSDADTAAWVMRRHIMGVRQTVRRTLTPSGK